MSTTESDSPTPTIVLLTDFGVRDGYVGVMKGVIASIAPRARVIDLSHDVPPQDIPSGTFILQASYKYFPAGALFVAVVDPGVGSSRRGILVASGGYEFIGPDNGLFTPFLDNAEVRVLDQLRYWLPSVSSTFHGRDVFAPVAAHRAVGVARDAIGTVCQDPVRVEPVRPHQESGVWTGAVVYVDRFGNLITNLPAEGLGENPRDWEAVTEGSTVWPVVGTYSAVGAGERCAVVGSSETVELSLYLGDAARITGLRAGAPVVLRRRGTVEPGGGD